MTASTRRRFLQAAAVTATAPFAVIPALHAGETPASAEEALFALVRLRFKHLTEEQLKAVQRSLRGSLAVAGVLQRTRLDPTDDPATIFVADL